MMGNGLQIREILLSSFSVLLSITLTGCMGLGSKAASMQVELAAGHVSNALAIVEKEDSSEEQVLTSLNKGMLLRMIGDYRGSNRIFEVAKKHIEELYGVSVSEQAGALLVNDTLRSYIGDRYEQILLHAYMALNYIELGDLDAARVEVLQADVKVQESGDEIDDVPFMRYLSGMIYEALGEKDQAVISYRQAKNTYQSTKEKQNLQIPAVLKTDLLRSLANGGFYDEFRVLKKELKMGDFKPRTVNKGFGELIVVLNSGLAPVRKEVAIAAVSDEIVNTVKISVPSYPQSKRRFSARLTSAQNVSVKFEVVEDIDALARAALSDDIAVITTRAIARAVIKHKSQKKIKDKGGALAGFLATVVNIASEHADTRSWTTLPQTIQLARVSLPAGMNTINIEIYSASGVLVDTLNKKIHMRNGQSTFLTEHWVAPNMAVNVVANKN